MAGLNRILVATDLSERSDRAVRRAVHLAEDLGARLTVLTALDDAMPDDVVDPLREKTHANLERFVASVAGDRAVELRTEVGDPTRAIIEAAEGTDLLVMGIHRPRPFLDVLRETTMQRVVRRSATPVLLVRDAADHPYRNALGACDFSPAATAAMRLALALAPGLRITPLHAVNVPYTGLIGSAAQAAAELEIAFRKEAEDSARLWAQESALPEAVGSCEIVVGPTPAVLRRRIEADGFDLVTAGAHGRVGAAPAILGSLASDLMREPPCDVLLARP